MGNSLEQWRASIGLFNSKCVIKQRVMVKVPMAFIFYYMSELLVLVNYYHLFLTISCVICFLR